MEEDHLSMIAMKDQKIQEVEDTLQAKNQIIDAYLKALDVKEGHD
jgi:hypothetical protein